MAPAKSRLHELTRGPRKGAKIWKRGVLRDSDIRKQRAVMVGLYMRKTGVTFSQASSDIKRLGMNQWRVPGAFDLASQMDAALDVEDAKSVVSGPKRRPLDYVEPAALGPPAAGDGAADVKAAAAARVANDTAKAATAAPTVSNRKKASKMI